MAGTCVLVAFLYPLQCRRLSTVEHGLRCSTLTHIFRDFRTFLVVFVVAAAGRFVIPPNTAMHWRGASLYLSHSSNYSTYVCLMCLCARCASLVVRAYGFQTREKDNNYINHCDFGGKWLATVTHKLHLSIFHEKKMVQPTNQVIR